MGYRVQWPISYLNDVRLRSHELHHPWRGSQKWYLMLLSKEELESAVHRS
jgi:hypothetical protein